MNEKRYLKWYNKIGYGSGDIAGNVVYAFLTFFVKPTAPTMPMSQSKGSSPGTKSAKAGPMLWPRPISL